MIKENGEEVVLDANLFGNNNRYDNHSYELNSVFTTVQLLDRH